MSRVTLTGEPSGLPTAPPGLNGRPPTEKEWGVVHAMNTARLREKLGAEAAADLEYRWEAFEMWGGARTFDAEVLFQESMWDLLFYNRIGERVAEIGIADPTSIDVYGEPDPEKHHANLVHIRTILRKPTEMLESELQEAVMAERSLPEWDRRRARIIKELDMEEPGAGLRSVGATDVLRALFR